MKNLTLQMKEADASSEPSVRSNEFKLKKPAVTTNVDNTTVTIKQLLYDPTNCQTTCGWSVLTM